MEVTLKIEEMESVDNIVLKKIFSGKTIHYKYKDLFDILYKIMDIKGNIGNKQILDTIDLEFMLGAQKRYFFLDKLHGFIPDLDILSQFSWKIGFNILLANIINSRGEVCGGISNTNRNSAVAYKVGEAYMEKMMSRLGEMVELKERILFYQCNFDRKVVSFDFRNEIDEIHFIKCQRKN